MRAKDLAMKAIAQGIMPDDLEIITADDGRGLLPEKTIRVLFGLVRPMSIEDVYKFLKPKAMRPTLSLGLGMGTILLDSLKEYGIIRLRNGRMLRATAYKAFACVIILDELTSEFQP